MEVVTDNVYGTWDILLQITGESVGEVRAASGMHQRKAGMARQADAFIALLGCQICAVVRAYITL
ncbi:Cytokinin riboside 5'-monophosphate phosphoribohydrolase LOG [Corchorus olitorius]|uniref:cytokinin riboside 5'-monophosphate phosphoribohydrolase n=1 Tax=Corchorus olitorius TaxID=93759 RepID=A0A1R3JJG6_9ROSI|nr:Cytokinin riboside 5'-monophosphate phosphoribohydrolase LOG [Corchorus olitorius]